MDELDKGEKKTRLKELYSKGAEIEDVFFFMQSGTGEHITNLRESAEKEQE